MFARLALFAVVALALAAGGQAKAAPLAYGTYYDEENVSVACAVAVSCRINFTQLPSDNLFLLKKINCLVTSSQPLILVLVSISQTSGGASFGRGIYVNPGAAVATSNPTEYNYSFQTDAQILIGQGRYPFIEAQSAAGGGFNMTCGILGDLVTPISGQ